MEALPFASWFKDSDGNFNQANEALLQFMNKELSDVIGKESSEVFDEEDARQSDAENGMCMKQEKQERQPIPGINKFSKRSISRCLTGMERSLEQEGTRRISQTLPGRCRNFTGKGRPWKSFWRTCPFISFSPTDSTGISGLTV